jgi:hypothetical protein
MLASKFRYSGTGGSCGARQRLCRSNLCGNGQGRISDPPVDRK